MYDMTDTVFENNKRSVDDTSSVVFVAVYTCELGHHKVSGDESLECSNTLINWLGDPLNCSGKNIVQPLINKDESKEFHGMASLV